MTSAYPRSVDALMPEARRLAAQLGHTPSRNRLMAELRVGKDKARAVLDRLAEANPGTGPTGADSATVGPGADPAGPAPADPSPVDARRVEPDPASPRRLHAVPDTATDPADPTESDRAAGVGPVLSGALPNPAAPPQPSTGTAPGPATDHPDHSARLGGWVTGWRRLLGTAPAAPVAAGTGVGRPARTWPLVLLALPAFVAIWSGWVGLGHLTGFGPVHPLPGIADGFTLNTAITLPIGVETYAAYALRVWLAGHGSTRARQFAKRSAIGALVLGAAGQVAYHLMTAHHVTAAPWEITTAVACLPVVVLGCGAALAHLQHTTDPTPANPTTDPAADPAAGLAAAGAVDLSTRD